MQTELEKYAKTKVDTSTWRKVILQQSEEHPHLQGQLGFACEPFKFTEKGKADRCLFSLPDQSDIALVNESDVVILSDNVAKMLDKYIDRSERLE